MAYSIEKLANEPIVIARFTSPFDAISDTGGAAKELNQLLAKAKGTLYYIPDLSQINVSFSDLAIGLAEAYKTPGNAYANHNLKTFTVGSDALIRVGAEAAAQQSQYGKADVHFYTSVESALDSVRAEIAKSA